MSREFKRDLAARIKDTFGIDLLINKKGIKFISEMVRKNKTADEALEILKKEYGLIEIKV